LFLAGTPNLGVSTDKKGQDYPALLMPVLSMLFTQLLEFVNITAISESTFSDVHYKRFG
jgi:hypothetical protein